MGTGKDKDDYTFYNGYEGEPELVLFSDNGSLHIWDGYIGDIFGDPDLNNVGWTGFTRDYNEFAGPYDEDCVVCEIDAEEYLADAVNCRGREVDYEESEDALETIIEWLENHKNEEVRLALK